MRRALFQTQTHMKEASQDKITLEIISPDQLRTIPDWPKLLAKDLGRKIIKSNLDFQLKLISQLQETSSKQKLPPNPNLTCSLCDSYSGFILLHLNKQGKHKIFILYIENKRIPKDPRSPGCAIFAMVKDSLETQLAKS